MKTAYCKINIGNLMQTVYIKDDNFSVPREETIPIHLLSSLFSKEENLSQVYLNGAPKNFLEKIEKETKEKQVLNNNKNNITFIYSQI